MPVAKTCQEKWLKVKTLKRRQNICKLDGKYSERAQLPAKAKFGGFVANTWQHLPQLLLEV